MSKPSAAPLTDQVARNRAAKRRGVMTGLALSAVLAVIALSCAELVPMSASIRDTLLGFAVGAGAAALAFLILLVLGIRGSDAALPRELSGRVDERDLVIWRTAWSWTGMVGFGGVVLGNLALTLGAPGTAILPVLTVVMLVVLYGSRVWLDRRM